MSGVHERLIEGWLDSASERSYQAPFCQMLVAEGYRILHSTRHSSIELGKDVVAVHPKGSACAYQLKGQPGGRLTLHAFREIQGQLRELTDIALPFSGHQKTQHRSFLVTNGYVEEEVRLAIEGMNAGNANSGYPDRRLEVIQRGDLLQMAQRLGASLWPTEIQGTHALLQMLVDEGDGPFPVERATSMLADMLGLGPVKQKWRAPELRRRITSAALLTSLSLQNFEARQNHLATAVAWVVFSVSAIAACERLELSVQRNAAASISVAMEAAKDALIDLTKEVLERDTMLEGDAVVDFSVYRGRFTLLLGLLALVWFWCEKDGWPDDLDRDALERFLVENRDQVLLWGEGAIPQILVYYWALRRLRPGVRSDSLLLSLLRSTIATDHNRQPKGLPSPYWDYESVVRHELSGFLGAEQDPMAEETGTGASYFAEGLMHLSVRANWKRVCKDLWPDFTRFQMIEFIPAEPWQHCTYRSEYGEYSQVQPVHRKEWADLVDEARSIRCDRIPPALVNEPFLHAFFMMVFPHRGTPDAVRRLSYDLNPVWLLAKPPVS
jgi:hypothetical protein